MKYWNGSRVEAEGADGKKRARRIPFSGLQRASDAARRPFCLAPAGLRRFWRWPVLLAWPRSAADIGAALAPWPASKSTATRLTPVFQQPPRIDSRRLISDLWSHCEPPLFLIPLREPRERLYPIPR
ncbi:MAG: hypothetical protein DME20_05435 [Verrucomicrobia bacterium]|nr:MAG: hypothetical protein DME71_04070 [Verrucomicrobiota bacterium]PYK49958.1 MAG: hypothetical protein DME20_05435 [Verrucomicrobiota bacterium]